MRLAELARYLLRPLLPHTCRYQHILRTNTLTWQSAGQAKPKIEPVTLNTQLAHTVSTYPTITGSTTIAPPHNATPTEAFFQVTKQKTLWLDSPTNITGVRSTHYTRALHNRLHKGEARMPPMSAVRLNIYQLNARYRR